MNMTEQHYLEDHTVSVRAEQAVLGALLRDNDALGHISDLSAANFYRHDHRLIFSELQRQIAAGQRADAMTLFPVLTGKVDDCLKYLGALHQSAVSAVNIRRHADIVADKAAKRALAALSLEMQELAASAQPAAACIDLVTTKLEALAQQKQVSEPMLMRDTLVRYLDTLQARMDGRIKPISTGHAALDAQLDGGLERGTLTVVAGRPGMGKTAFGLGVARNMSENDVTLFYSMEMSLDQVNDRNIAALGRVPLSWLRKPGETTDRDDAYWTGISHGVRRSDAIRLYIEPMTGLNMLEIRAKARNVKRRACALDALVIDQLSFITGGKSDKSYEAVGEHTRGLVALAKELNCAVILLCQLSRECEKRPNKRPIMADLAMSGSIEQDAANIIFLYRDEVYNPNTTDKGICEVNSIKQRQGRPGVIGLGYDGAHTMFTDLAYPWRPHEAEEKPAGRRGFGG